MNTADVEAAADHIWRSGKKPTVGRIAAILKVSPVELVEHFLDSTSDEAVHLATLSDVARHGAALKIDWQTLIWDDTDLDDLPNQPDTRAAARLAPAPTQQPTPASAPRFLTEPASPGRVGIVRRHRASTARTRASRRTHRQTSTS